MERYKVVKKSSIHYEPTTTHSQCSLRMMDKNHIIDDDLNLPMANDPIPLGFPPTKSLAAVLALLISRDILRARRVH